MMIQKHFRALESTFLLKRALLLNKQALECGKVFRNNYTTTGKSLSLVTKGSSLFIEFFRTFVRRVQQ